MLTKARSRRGVEHLGGAGRHHLPRRRTTRPSCWRPTSSRPARACAEPEAVELLSREGPRLVEEVLLGDAEGALRPPARRRARPDGRGRALAAADRPPRRRHGPRHRGVDAGGGPARAQRHHPHRPDGDRPADALAPLAQPARHLRAADVRGRLRVRPGLAAGRARCSRGRRSSRPAASAASSCTRPTRPARAATAWRWPTAPGRAASTCSSSSSTRRRSTTAGSGSCCPSRCAARARGWWTGTAASS